MSSYHVDRPSPSSLRPLESICLILLTELWMNTNDHLHPYNRSAYITSLQRKITTIVATCTFIPIHHTVTYILQNSADIFIQLPIYTLNT